MRILIVLLAFLASALLFGLGVHTARAALAGLAADARARSESVAAAIRTGTSR